MNPQSSCVTSKWVDFLRQYGPIPRNDNMYDEAIQRALAKGKVQPIRFDSEYLDELVENFRSTQSCSVILTGTAGDGKTFYCREVWQALGGSAHDWERGGKIQSLAIAHKTLVVVKDLSELLSGEKSSLLSSVAEAITNPDSPEVYLIAANDGQLVEAWAVAGSAPAVQTVRRGIEDLLVGDQREKANLHLRLYNLSRLSAARALPRILNAVLQHPGWNECSSCPYREPSDLSQRCPIWENKSRLEGKSGETTTRDRLIDLLELAELNGLHLPIRQLLLLTANTLLGHPEGKDRLLSCRQIPQIVSNGQASLASLYRNILGENLTQRKRDSTDVFTVLGRFGIGTETNNRIDNILIFGEDSPDLKSYYDEFVLADEYYGANQNYRATQRAYLEGTLSEGGKEFLGMLRTQRQRLFFTIPSERAADMNVWDLTMFQNAGEYLESVYRSLQQGEKIPKKIVSRLVRGLNRIFTGLLVSNQDELILATSGSYSQARISKVFEDSISVSKKRGEFVAVELGTDHGQPELVVSFSAHPEVPSVALRLHLIRYEYLSRVAEGVLPSSFSQECYTDILAFKTQVLSQLSRRRQLEEELEETDNYVTLRLLDLNTEGIASPYPVEVQL
jgi:hypothetical protein